MRRVCWGVLLTAVAGMAATTTVTQMVTGPDGQASGGKALIRISQACEAGGKYVGERTIPITFTADVPAGKTNNFSVDLVPNDAGGCAGTSYTVGWLLTGGINWNETWVVPTSGSPVLIDAVVVGTVPAREWMIQWQQMAQNGAAVGQAPVWNGSSWVPGYVTGSGAVWGSITGTLCNQSDLCTTLAGKVGTSDSRLSDARTPLSHVHLIADITGLQTAIDGKSAVGHTHPGVYEPANANIQTHIASTSNPHSVTKAQIGLGNAENTADANKPISTATQSALDLKAPLASPTFSGVVDSHGASKTLPHRTGTGSPVARDACATIGETYFQTDATAGSNSFACTATGTPGTWSLQGSGSGGGSAIAPYLSGLIAGPDLTKTITAAVHHFATPALLVAVYDNATPREVITAGWTVDPMTYDVVVTFASPQSNYYVVINGGTGPQGQQGIQGPAGVGDMVKANNLSDLVNIPTARGNLGLGGAALLNVGTIAGTVAAGNDSRLSDARTPTAHTTSHKNGGSDEVATATPAANAIPKAGSGGTLASGWLPGAGYRVCIIDNDTQSATALATGQVSGGCEFPSAATIIEVQVWGGTGAVGGTVTSTGTSSVNLERFTPNGGATSAILSGALATVSGFACAASGASCLNGLAKSGSITLSTTAIAAGDWVRVSAATLDGTQTWYRVGIAYTVN